MFTFIIELLSNTELRRLQYEFEWWIDKPDEKDHKVSVLLLPLINAEIAKRRTTIKS